MIQAGVERARLWLAEAGARRGLPGMAGSLLLHGIGLALVLLFLMRHAPPSPGPEPRLIPVEMVPLGEATRAPPAPVKAKVPQQEALKGPTAAPKPHGVRPHARRPMTDDLEVRLKQMAKLRQPDSRLKIENGASDMTATSDGAEAGPESYSVRDAIRAQVLRRWNLDISDLGERRLTIRLKLVLTGQGSIAAIAIDGMAAHKKDKVWHAIALSARNAVTLSAPFALPQSLRTKGFETTIDLNPRDTLR